MITLHSEDETIAFAENFAKRLKTGDVVALSGPLGAGKTTFVRAIVRTLHGCDAGSSPTFTFWHRYDGAPPIDHLDFYRIDNSQETAELGLEEAFDGRSIVLVEWWQNAPELIPPRRYEIEMQGAGGDIRTILVRETP
jgi:tRNA threonylcarbamoyl adenosine modification protein YjeE